jgi:hypothetical protein
MRYTHENFILIQSFLSSKIFLFYPQFEGVRFNTEEHTKIIHMHIG